MAATDQTYRNQRMVDIVFGVSSILLLLSVIWMFAQDYFREFKVEQREFRDVESALAEREMLNKLPDTDKIREAEQKLAQALKARNAMEKKLDRDVRAILPLKAQIENKAQAVKADYDSVVSLYNIEVDKLNAAKKDSSASRTLKARTDELLARVNKLGDDLAKSQLEVENINKDLEDARTPQSVTFTVTVDGKEEVVERNPREVLKEAVDAEDALKKLTDDFDRFAKQAVQKRWGLGDRIRAFPVIDAFRSPIRIEQYTLEGLPIDYNFKYVTRFDRCATCHQGIDRFNFGKEAIKALTRKPDDKEQERLKKAKIMLQERRKILSMQETSYDERDLPSLLKPLALSEARINEFCAHPRLDLFVSGESPHPAEKFGCTICHAGQGSATDFLNAAHTPNDFSQKNLWKHDPVRPWQANHYWDFPMLPKRFLESTCLKCHYQVTDLLPEGNKVEYRAPADDKGNVSQVKIDAPGVKVTRGYNLVREFGCFGCHEIPGIKGGRWVGPDLRLEPAPPLEDLSPEARVKALADPLNPPGTLRKVGPSLRRLSEKTNEEWARKWIYNPRSFRPDTKMPHFYNLSNNNPAALDEQFRKSKDKPGMDQRDFPEAEIHAVAYYLFRKSEAYLDSAKKISDPKLKGDYKENKARGRQLFTEKGCLACHIHEKTTEEFQRIFQQQDKPLPELSHFGPNLTRLAAKLGDKPGDAKARRWLIGWIKDPKTHHPRTFMPVTHLEEDQAADIAAWLLDQQVKDWDAADVKQPSAQTLVALARAYSKNLSELEVDEILADGGSAERIQKNLLDADDKDLANTLDLSGKLKVYIGKKALNQMGCFGCHDIAGLESAKPIGTPLNDWGKKDPERLAFEDVIAYVNKNYYEVDRAVEANGFGHPIKKENEIDKEPYEKFYLEALQHQQREGFLHQKLREPRSYDYDRIRPWHERLRMPQFKFARGEARPIGDESHEQAELRAEAEAREAVMTFILGLIAEPIPLKYVYDPPSQRLALVKGKQVLDKYNCAGCHQIKAGIYEFSTKPRPTDDGMTRVVLEELEGVQKKSLDPKDHPFPGHNAWTGQLSANPDRVKAHGIPFGKEAPGATEESIRFRLTQALRFNRPADADLTAAEREKKALDIPAAQSLDLPANELIFRAEPQGGVFTDLLAVYLVDRRTPSLDKDETARSGLPPPLLREGEKVQPSWLFGFLRNPYEIRPITILRMPRFNMSDDEAMTLVNYFNVVDKTGNPGVTLNYPYLAIPQRDEGFLSAETEKYVALLKTKKLEEQRLKSLKPIWEKFLPEQRAELEDKIKIAKEAVEKARADENKEKDAKKKTQLELARIEAEKGLKRLQDDLDKLQKFTGQQERWEGDRAYATDAYRLLVNNDTCLNCHLVGNWGKAPPLGPRLDPVLDRLRPDWTERWIASPQRLLIYPNGFHPMTQVFSRGEAKYQDSFAGSSLEQVKAVRDLLMIYPKAANFPENRLYRPPQGANP